ncbi:phosphoglycerate dehydrogenase [Lignipirellula cremea]|uniref:D-3-phosphoglycerate dehydrogenase n=1 Tax=Lignipirellula cremea TaxID=2528010 RepID=A0A518E0K0_9BACT|nr:phosphoglycerate dehydrogenase [Lignipirellula cremea]QDU97618.1 D-3-phosphoglycerate dehydrogenase [Lignipirellula cremea]
MPRVLVTPTMLLRKPGAYSEILEQGGFEVVYPPEGADTQKAEVIGPLVQTVDAVLASTEPLRGETLASSTLRAIARMGVGYDSVDIRQATELGIAVTITPGVLEDSVAEHTMAMLLALTRDIVKRDREVREGVWPRLGLPRLAGKTFGIIGLGRIGRAVAERALGFQMKVIAFDPFADPAFAATQGIEMLSLEDLLASSDVVSLHAASTPETRDLINATTLGQIKQGAILVNTSRGDLVDEDALCDALRNGKLWGAALDVFKKEPLPLDSELLTFPNVLLCTHMGGLDLASEVAGSSLAAQCIVDLYQNKPPLNCMVNRQIADGWKW